MATVLCSLLGLSGLVLLVVRLWLRRAVGSAGRLRVALVGDSFAPKIDGVATRTWQATRFLPSMGNDVLIMTSIRKNDEPLNGVPVVTLPGYHPAAYSLHSLTLPSWRMVSTLLRFKPDVVHLVDETVITAFCAVACWALGIPTVFSHHTRIDLITERYAPTLASTGLHKPLLRWLQWGIAGRSAVHLVVGVDMMEQLSAAGCSGLRVWPVGTDTELFSNERTDDALRTRLTDGRPCARLVLYVGRVAPEKSLHLLPAVVDECNRTCSDGEATQFVVVGDGPYLATLKQACAGKPVTFIGQIPHGPELASLYATADAFYSPSCFETLGQVYLEAMASGTPVVAVGAAGALEVIQPGFNGFHTKPDDVLDAAQHILVACALKRDACAAGLRSFSRAGCSSDASASTLSAQGDGDALDCSVMQDSDSVSSGGSAGDSFGGRGDYMPPSSRSLHEWEDVHSTCSYEEPVPWAERVDPLLRNARASAQARSWRESFVVADRAYRDAAATRWF